MGHSIDIDRLNKWVGDTDHKMVFLGELATLREKIEGGEDFHSLDSLFGSDISKRRRNWEQQIASVIGTVDTRNDLVSFQMNLLIAMFNDEAVGWSCPHFAGGSGWVYQIWNVRAASAIWDITSDDEPVPSLDQSLVESMELNQDLSYWVIPSQDILKMCRLQSARHSIRFLLMEFWKSIDFKNCFTAIGDEASRQLLIGLVLSVLAADKDDQHLLTMKLKSSLGRHLDAFDPSQQIQSVPDPDWVTMMESWDSPSVPPEWVAQSLGKYSVDDLDRIIGGYLGTGAPLHDLR